jgi:hypothetical protein
MLINKPHESELWWAIDVLRHPGHHDVDEKDKATDLAVTTLERVKWLKYRLEEETASLSPPFRGDEVNEAEDALYDRDKEILSLFDTGREF